ncbi:hypothetical protein BHM03_00038249 [Ensete ventricosum]|nr:hypothetical protein BHM03_00038249 [Ensete ventricosum]
MSAGPPPSGLRFPMDDPDLDDAELWAVIDSAAASRSLNPLLALKNPNPLTCSPSPMGSKPFRNPRQLRVTGEVARVPADGEVVQEEHWDHRRPHKMARLVESGTVVDERRMVVVRHPQRPSVVAVSSPSYWSPDQARFVAKSGSPVVESPPPEGWKSEEKENMSHSLGGRFPSVSSFKHYQNTAMAVNSCFFLLALPCIEMARLILEKSDYTMIHGNPFIKKSDGWGSCDRPEKKFSKPNHDIPSTAETRAKNKACQVNKTIAKLEKVQCGEAEALEKVGALEKSSNG